MKYRRASEAWAVLLVVAVGAGAVGCTNSPSVSSPQRAVSSETGRESQAAIKSKKLVGKTATVIVSGLACPSCAAGVDQQLSQTPGVTSVDVDPAESTVRLTLDPAKAPTEEDIKEAIRHGGGVFIELRQP